MVQVLLQPSWVAVAVPSSHSSPISTTPLPHSGLTHTEGPKPTQVQPASSWQVASQPSRLAGSHSSPVCTTLSPQKGLRKQTPACGQVQPFCTAQVAEQPMLPFGGSHVSPS